MSSYTDPVAIAPLPASGQVASAAQAAAEIEDIEYFASQYAAQNATNATTLTTEQTQVNQAISSLTGQVNTAVGTIAPAITAENTNLQTQFNNLQTTLQAALSYDATDTALTVASGWSNRSGFQPLMVRKVPGNMVVLTGVLLATAAVTSGASIATLPAGYAPPAQIVQWALTNGPGTAGIIINGTSITLDGPNIASGNYFAISSIYSLV